MYTLSNLLSDEQKLLSSLLDISISGDKTHGLTAIEKKEVAAKFRNQESNLFNLSKSESTHLLNAKSSSNLSKELQQVLDKIEGITGILDSRTRILLMHGELIELDSNDYRPIQNQGTIYGVLLNDCFIMSTSFSTYTRLSNKRYKFQNLYELDNIASINVKDPNIKNAFKILMQTQSRVFMVDNLDLKNKWLESFDQAKKQRRASLTLQRRDSLMLMQPHNNLSSSSLQNQVRTPMSPIDRPYSSILSSFENSELLDEVAELPEWLTDVPEDLDVFIAQRNFDEAVALINKVNDYFQSYLKSCDNQMQKDLKLRINNKMQDLIDAISNELQITPDRSLQSGPKSARKGKIIREKFLLFIFLIKFLLFLAVNLLIKLGKSSLATKLYLHQRTGLIKFCIKQQKIDGATIQYIKRLSSVFFNNLTDTCREFKRAFDLNNSAQSNNDLSYQLTPALSALVIWARKQLIKFLSLFRQHVFSTQNLPSNVAECFSIVRHHCVKLSKINGLNLIYLLEFELNTGLNKVILDYESKMLEGISIRCNDDKWKAQNHQNKAGVNKFIEEMKECGLGVVANYVFDECRVYLTQNTTTFAKNYLNFVKDLLKMHTEFTHSTIIEAICETFRIQMKHFETSLKSDKFVNDKKLIRKNVVFLIETVLELAKDIYRETLNEESDGLNKLKQDYLNLKNESNVTVIEKGKHGTKVMIDFL